MYKSKRIGMFLYARLVLDYLSSNIFFSGEEIKASVYKLPDRLAEFYSKILTQILVRLDSRSVERVKCALGWIAFSKRPLKKIEFLSAIAFSSGDTTVKQIAPQYMLEICATLIEERPDSTLGFIHLSVKEFLQSSSSNLALVERDCLVQHGIATVTCLLAGIETFPYGLPQDSVLVSIIKGLHGFHIYSKEHWTDYLLSLSLSNEKYGSSTTLFFDLACELAAKLNQLSKNPVQEQNRLEDLNVDNQQTSETPANDRVGNFSSALLQHVIDRCLKARSLEQLELELKQMESRDQPIEDTAPSAIPPPQEGVSIVLQRYQTAVRYLLEQADYPGIAATELDAFKWQFRDSAYTCRIRHCPRAIIGFEHQAQCSEHEILHVRTLPCRYPGCQSPAFMSSKHLKRHIDKEHVKPAPPKTIRKVGNLPPRKGFEYQALQQSGSTPENNPEPPEENLVNEAELEGLIAAVSILPPVVFPVAPARVSARLPILYVSQLMQLGQEWRFVYEKYVIQNLNESQKVQLGGIFIRASQQKDPMNTLNGIIMGSLFSLDPDSIGKFVTLVESATADPDILRRHKFELPGGFGGHGEDGEDVARDQDHTE
ncbi:uncharacterized protein PG986_005636, partial [Apiospora aurea]